MAEKSWVLCTGMRCHIWRNSVDFVDIRSRYLFSKTSIYCKIKTIAFLFASFVLSCFVYRTPGIILTMNKDFNYSDTAWAPWCFRTKTTHYKRPKLCITPVGGGGGGGGGYSLYEGYCICSSVSTPLFQVSGKFVEFRPLYFSKNEENVIFWPLYFSKNEENVVFRPLFFIKIGQNV